MTTLAERIHKDQIDDEAAEAEQRSATKQETEDERAYRIMLFGASTAEEHADEIIKAAKLFQSLLQVTGDWDAVIVYRPVSGFIAEIRDGHSGAYVTIRAAGAMLCGVPIREIDARQDIIDFIKKHDAYL